ncbi:hypothetical protein [Nocardia wallacei]|uniref:hypothetical protein n=1 Tax=Nocardia wallacei TaxID=480035 RepID=UPI0024540527|nr:hypothetical protein [Nocardia wallacei]
MMRKRIRVALLAGVFLAAPLSMAAPASAVSLEPAQSQPESVDLICTMQYPPTLACLLSSLSASISSGPHLPL